MYCSSTPLSTRRNKNALARRARGAYNIARMSVRKGEISVRLRRAFVEVLKFKAVFKALTLFIIAPLLREIYQTYIASVGVAFNENMLGTFLSFKGALVFLALFFAAALLIFYEISAVINIVSLCRAGRDFTLAGAMKGSVWNLGAMRGKSALLAALYFVLLLPVVKRGLCQQRRAQRFHSGIYLRRTA